MRKSSKWRRDLLYSSKWLSEVLVHNHLALFLVHSRQYIVEDEYSETLCHDNQQAERGRNYPQKDIAFKDTPPMSDLLLPTRPYP